MATPTPCAGTSAPQLLVEPNPVVPYRYGAMSAYVVLDDTDEHGRNGIMYKSPFCAGVDTFVDNCDSGSVVAKTPTDVDQDAVVVGCPFTLYSYLSCKGVGDGSLAALFPAALTALQLGEQRGVEQNVWAQVLAVTASVVVNASSLPADALSLVAALAALESRVADFYGGQATIHANRGLANYAADHRQLEKQGTAAFTPLGSRWAFYAGDPNTGPTGAAAPDGYAWVYATSVLTLRRFPTILVPESVDYAFQFPTNEPAVIAERTYVPSVECAQFAALVCLPAACG